MTLWNQWPIPEEQWCHLQDGQIAGSYGIDAPRGRVHEAMSAPLRKAGNGYGAGAHAATLTAPSRRADPGRGDAAAGTCPTW